MERLSRHILIAVAIGTATSLALSVWPGGAEMFHLAFLILAIYSLPLGLVALLIAVAALGGAGLRRLRDTPIPRACHHYLGLAVGTLALWYFAVSLDLPMKLAFLPVEDAFRAAALDAPRPEHPRQDYRRGI